MAERFTRRYEIQKARLQNEGHRVFDAPTIADGFLRTLKTGASSHAVGMYCSQTETSQRAIARDALAVVEFTSGPKAGQHHELPILPQKLEDIRLDAAKTESKT